MDEFETKKFQEFSNCSGDANELHNCWGSYRGAAQLRAYVMNRCQELTNNAE